MWIESSHTENRYNTLGGQEARQQDKARQKISNKLKNVSRVLLLLLLRMNVIATLYSIDFKVDQCEIERETINIRVL